MSFAGEHTIKGLAKPQKVWGIKSVRKGVTRFDASVGRGLSAYIGRENELAMLRDALQRARDRFRVIDIVAEPGLGKTRLVFEFRQRLKVDETFVLTGNCSADGQRIPFLPFLEVMRGAFRIRPEDDPAEIARKLETGLRGLELHTTENLGLLLNLLGLEPPEASLAGLDGVLIGLRTRDLLPGLLKAQCRASTVVLLLEDIHWIDGVSQEMPRQPDRGWRAFQSSRHPHAATRIRSRLARRSRRNDPRARATNRERHKISVGVAARRHLLARRVDQSSHGARRGQSSVR